MNQHVRIIAISFISVAVLVPTVMMWPVQRDVLGQLVEETGMETVVISPEQMSVGMTLHRDIFYFFRTFEKTQLPVLLSDAGPLKGQKRFWGFCSMDLREARARTDAGKPPVRMFLSALEQQERGMSVDLQTITIDGVDIENEVLLVDANTDCAVTVASATPFGIDSDGDKLNNEMESILGTDPLLPDTDGDTVDDGTEVGLKSDPLVTDTDGDGLPDGLEVEIGTSPTITDSDGDGPCDGVCYVQISRQVLEQYGEDLDLDGVVDEGETDPLNPDTDGDGIWDGVEIGYPYTR